MNKDKDDSFTLLLIEDNAADVLLLQEALAEMNLEVSMQVMHDGEETMQYLLQREPYGQADAPDIILLDLNLPKKDGFAVLEEIKQDGRLQHIPVIVLSTSEAEEDINRCYRLHANCFITKPLELDDFMAAVQSITDFWLKTVRLPQRSGT